MQILHAKFSENAQSQHHPSQLNASIFEAQILFHTDFTTLPLDLKSQRHNTAYSKQFQHILTATAELMIYTMELSKHCKSSKKIKHFAWKILS